MDSPEDQRGRTQLTITISDQVRGIASDLFGIPDDGITNESSPETVEAWDSTQHLNFVLALEEKFGIQLSPEEMEQIKNIGQASQLVENKLHNLSR